MNRLTTEQRGFRNNHGVKESAYCYRTINGEHYAAWTSCPSLEAIAKYRKAGLRCRRIGDELYMHILDHDEASKIDAA